MKIGDVVRRKKNGRISMTVIWIEGDYASVMWCSKNKDGYVRLKSNRIKKNELKAI